MHPQQLPRLSKAKEAVQMRRSLFMVLVCLAVGSLIGLAQESQVPGLILTDLQLISHESLPQWSSAWTGPIQAATIAAWFADHGYPALMQDFNGDGVIDELDTIQLADRFGEGEMDADAEIPPTDARVAITLAKYFADRYPDEFVMKIYDLTFPNEYGAEYPGSFAPDMVPGIEIVIEEEPSVESYAYELASGEGVIVGLEQDDDINMYLAGRSFIYEQTPEGFTPVDFAWSKENRFEPGHQGIVLDTVAMMDDRFYVDFFDWVPVEFMLALSPVHERGYGASDYACPDDAIAYHDQTYSVGDLGELRIEECVLRDGPEDTYIYIITNISILYGGCGLCSFSIPNPGLPTLAHSEPPPSLFSALPNLWHWWVPTGSCGLMPGQTAVVSVTVPGPTIDTWVDAPIGFCAATWSFGSAPVLITVQTTGPSIGECPDLVVENPVADCTYNPSTQEYDVTVTADIANIGAVPAEAPFVVSLKDTLNHMVYVGIPDDLADGGSYNVTFEYSFSAIDLPAEACPLLFVIIVDSSDQVEECDEENNMAEGETCCSHEPNGPLTVVCPDLIVEVLDEACAYSSGELGHFTYFEIKVKVSNIGNASTQQAFVVELDPDCLPGELEETMGPLGAHRSEILTFQFFRSDWSVINCAYEVIVDPDESIWECNEDNNSLTDRLQCENPPFDL